MGSAEQILSGSGSGGYFSGSGDHDGENSYSGSPISEQDIDIMMSETEVSVEEEENDGIEIEENDLRGMLSSNNILMAETVPLESDIEAKEEEEDSLLDVDVLEELGVVQLDSDFE